MANVVCAQNLFKRKGAKPILQSDCTIGSVNVDQKQCETRQYGSESGSQNQEASRKIFIKQIHNSISFESLKFN